AHAAADRAARRAGRSLGGHRADRRATPPARYADSVWTVPRGGRLARADVGSSARRALPRPLQRARRMNAPGSAPRRIGLTGGIASGKTTVSDLFAAHGVPVLDADIIAREVVAPGTALLAQLFDRFGPRIRRPDGHLDRSALRRMVFEDASLRRALEALLHPAIRARTEQLASQANGPYQLHVIPLLVETGAFGRYDRVLVVGCPESLQWARLRARDAGRAGQAGGPAPVRRRCHRQRRRPRRARPAGRRAARAIPQARRLTGRLVSKGVYVRVGPQAQ